MISDREKKILTNLRTSKKKSITSIAKQSNIPISTAAEIIKRLEQDAIIQHKTKVDFERIGFPHSFIMNIKNCDHKKGEVQFWLENNSFINTIRLINDGFDFHVETIFQNKKQKIDFIDKLRSIHSGIEVQTHEIISTISEDQFVPTYHEVKPFF